MLTGRMCLGYSYGASGRLLVGDSLGRERDLWLRRSRRHSADDECPDGPAISTGRIACASSISSRIRAEVEEAVDRYAEQFHVPPGLLLAVINAESGFNSHRNFGSKGDPALSHRMSDA